ncbi:MAG: hydantoinase B/oxoprolinase family protein [Methylobacteriaceae bacterium]|nr:hydantoinase B/oxoprolinase family protein [Methylobacteriaceae bacterium]
MISLGSDIGGTFTDLVVIDEATGKIDIEKVLTTPSDPSLAIERGLQGFDDRVKDCVAQASLLVHGTTLVINAVLERKGAVTGLITTRGFRDVIEIATEKRYDGNDLQLDLPAPLVPRPLRVEADERMHASGVVLKELDESSVIKAAETLLAKGAKSIAVCLINSFANPAHEKRVGEILEEVAPGVPVTLSHEVMRELKEYERATTTTVNAYAKPVVSRYLAMLEKRLERLKFSGDLLLMQSSGGINSAEHARNYPVQIIESGPAAGAIAAAHYASLSGQNTVLAFDMGGTTAKMCLVKDGRVARVHELEVGRVRRFKRGSGLPVRIPVVDLMEIGAGGGSLAQISAKGTLEVGPESSGAEPGPACYGLGGEQPTVSDADLLLGYLNAEYFLGAQMKLNMSAARKAIETHLAKPLGITAAQAAWGVHSVVNENMASAAKVYVAEKGEDPASCAIVAFGGAGPVHASDLARRIGARTVLVPPRAGVASAFGMLVAPMTFDTVRTHRVRLSKTSPADLHAVLAELESEARSGMPASTSASAITFERSLDVRYLGQGYDVSVPVGSADDLSAISVRKAFNEVYLHLYGRVFDQLELEIMNVRVRAVAPGRRFVEQAVDHVAMAADAAMVSREAYCPVIGDFVAHRVFPRNALKTGVEIAGPAIVEEAESTTIINSDSTLTVDKSGSLIVSLFARKIAEAPAGPANERLDAISLEMLWRKLGSSVDELAAALVRTSFSTVVRDVKDYACAVFDGEGRLLVQSSDSTPGIAGGLGPMLRHMLERYPGDKLSPGDVLIGNDPWHGSGHHVDIFVATPAFHHGKVVGFAVSAAHHVDIGGRRATTESRDNYEEGLRIPVCKIFKAGEPNEDVFAFIASNVRMSDTVIGDLRAQFAANHVGCERLAEICAQRGWPDLQLLADEIISRSERIARAEIASIKDGVYTHEAPIGVIGGQELRIHAQVTVAGEEIVVDFSDSSPQVASAINCTLTYTAAYSVFAVIALLNLPIPTNHGTLAPITVRAKPGTMLNAQFPAPVFARTTIGNFVPEMIFTTLAAALPERVVAGCGGTPLWAQYIFGKRRDGTSFATLNAASGGLGARHDKDGVSCLTFPVNIGNTPVEILETDLPLIVARRELWQDSAGPGRTRGGHGQIFELLVPDGELGPDGPILIGFRGGRYDFPVPGLLNGRETPKGIMLVAGSQAGAGGDTTVQPGGSIVCQIPGGGGLGDPRERDPALIRRDLEFGYISAEHAEKAYGYSAKLEAAKKEVA